MWLIVGLLATTFLWITIRAEEEDEMLINGLPKKCGERPPLSKPAAGYDGSKTEALPHSWPWHVGVYFSGYGRYPYCGGTLMSPTWVLTAAHCIPKCLVDIRLGRPFRMEDFTNETLAVRIGSHNYTKEQDLDYGIQVKHVIMHANFPLGGAKIGFDYALLKLKREVKRSPHVAFACLPKSAPKVKDGLKCYSAGWGLIALSKEIKKKDQPEVLMELPGKIQKEEACQVFINRKGHMCVQQSTATSCVGDSGGGLHCQTQNKTWAVYGVLSRSSKSCYNGYVLFGPTVPALSWIKTTIQKFN